jgi:hypothetical protein
MENEELVEPTPVKLFPVIVADETVAVAVPVFEIVRLWVDGEPTATLPKLKLAGLADRTAVEGGGAVAGLLVLLVTPEQLASTLKVEIAVMISSESNMFILECDRFKAHFERLDHKSRTLIILSLDSADTGHLLTARTVKVQEQCLCSHVHVYLNW